MKGSWSEKVVLLAIILLAAFTYFYKLGQIPNSVSDDEAVVGYNAYSILLTGKDEFGKSFPLAFRFFGAYTPPLFVYAAVPFIKWFGLDIVSLRTISAVATLLGILVIYFFVKKLPIFSSPPTALVAAFLFAISPWVFYYARIGYEVTFGYILFSLGTLLLWNRLARNRISLIGLAVLSFSTYAAHTERYLVPIFLLAVAYFFRKTIFVRRNLGLLVIGALILFISQLPNFFLLTTKAFWVKNESFGNANLGQQLKDFVDQYLTYLSPRAIFGNSPDINLQHTAPAIPLLYSWLIIPFFIGLYQLYGKIKTTGGKFLAILLLTAPIPGAFSGHFISIQRVLPLIIPLILVIALGFDAILQRVRLIIFLPVFCLFSALSLLLLWRSYFVFFPKERFPYWSYGYEQMSQIIKKSPESRFVIDSARGETTYIDFLFYLKYPPAEYQTRFSPEFERTYYENPNLPSGHKFANLDIRPIVWREDPLENQYLIGDTLAISSDQAKEHFLTSVFEIKDPNDKVIFFGYQTNPDMKQLDNLRKQSPK